MACLWVRTGRFDFSNTPDYAFALQRHNVKAMIARQSSIVTFICKCMQCLNFEENLIEGWGEGGAKNKVKDTIPQL